MTGLVPLKTACRLLGCTTPKTAQRRLDDLGVDVVRFGRRVYVDLDDVRRAIEARKRCAAGSRSPNGITLAPGERLW